jgi:hypothetical protein
MTTFFCMMRLKVLNSRLYKLRCKRNPAMSASVASMQQAERTLAAQCSTAEEEYDEHTRILEAELKLVRAVSATLLHPTLQGGYDPEPLSQATAATAELNEEYEACAAELERRSGVALADYDAARSALARAELQLEDMEAEEAERVQALLGLYPIVTSQYSSTSLYQVSYVLACVQSSCFSNMTIGFIPRRCGVWGGRAAWG